MVAPTGKTGEENLDLADELVYQKLIEGMRKVCLFRPQLDYFNMLNTWETLPIFNLTALVFRKRLGHFLSVLGEPVPL